MSKTKHLQEIYLIEIEKRFVMNKRYVEKDDKKTDDSSNKISISIVVPCYNQEQYIETCLTSIINQTLKNFEVICVNDGSTDNTLEIINKFKSDDPRVKVISFESNMGTSQARKEGVLNSIGEYVMFADPDDTFAENAFEIAYKNIKKRKVDILQFGTNVINCGVKESVYNYFLDISEPYPDKIYGTDVFFYCFKFNLYNFNLWNKIYNGNLARNAFKEINDGYYPKAEDMYAFFILSYFAKSYDSIKDKLYNYYYGRGITGQSTISLDRFSKVCTQMQIIEQLYKFIENNSKENFQEYIEILANRGKILYNEIINNFKNIENLQINYKVAVEEILKNLQPKINFSNKSIYKSYINFIFDRFSDILFVDKLKYELVTYDYLIRIYQEQNLDELTLNSKLFFKIKYLSNCKDKKHIIPIVFATNDNYAPYLATAIQSIKEHSNKNNMYDMYVFHTSLSMQNQLLIDSLTEVNISIRFIDVTPYIKNIKVYSHGHYSVEMYYRILIPEILSEYDKVLYLDCDLIVNTDIAELYSIDISNYILGVVLDEITTDDMLRYLNSTLKFPIDKYFNSGVLMINTKKFNENGIKQKCFDVLDKSPRLACPDQDILNISCRGEVLYLSNEWNYQCAPNNYTLLDRYLTKKNIIHYTSPFKPWNTVDLPLSEYFWKYAKNTPYYENILRNYLAITLELSSHNPSGVKNRNIINKNHSKKNFLTWPFRMTKKFIVSVQDFGWRRTMRKVKGKLKYVFDRMFHKVDKFNNKINKQKIEKNTNKKTRLKIKDYPAELEKWFYSKTNVKFDIENPKTFSEKIQWLKIYDASILKSHLTDKWLAKEYVKSVLGEKYIIKTYGVFDKFEDIDFEKLPNQFVIKSTHGSGQIEIVRDKNLIDKNKLKEKTQKWLGSTYASHSGFEMHYQNIIPRLIVEELIEGIDNDLYDYKIMCFNGNPEFIWVDTDRFNGHKRTLFDLNWNKMPIKYNYENSSKKISKPKNLKQLLKLAKQLSKGFSLCRCDFYVLPDDTIKFGELTFTSGSGIDRFDPVSFDYELGKKLKLPEKKIFQKLSESEILKSEKKFLKSLDSDFNKN